MREKKEVKIKNYKLTDYITLPSIGPRKIKAEKEDISVLKSQQTQTNSTKTKKFFKLTFYKVSPFPRIVGFDMIGKLGSHHHCWKDYNQMINQCS